MVQRHRHGNTATESPQRSVEESAFSSPKFRCERLPLVCVMIVVIKSVAFHSHSLEGKISFAGGILFEEEAGAVARRAHTEKAAEELPDRASRGL